jgi:hypothetical protein
MAAMSSSTLTFKTFSKRVLAGIVLVMYTLLLGEGYFRLVDPQALMPRYVSGTAWGVRGNIPHADYWNHTPDVDVEYRINGQGLRADHDYPEAKPAGTCRIAVFGDSFFFGIELDFEHTYEGQLEKRLTEAGYRAEVMNFAVGGFGTAEMLQTFEQFGRKFAPDVAIFSWDDSDLQDNVRSGLYRLQDGALIQANAEYLPGVKTSDWLMRHSLYRLIADHSELYAFARETTEVLVKRRLKAQGKPDNDDDEAAAQEFNARQKRAGIELSSALLLKTREVVAASGADFYLVEIPFKLSRTQFRSSLDMLPAELRSQINMVDTAGALSKVARPDLKLYYEAGQGHLSPYGMSILVDQTMKHLVTSPQLASCKPQG